MSIKKILPPLSTLHPFETTARHLSFSKAAEELFVTQAAISKQVRSLEKFLGLKLFVRHGRTVSLTEEGEKFQHAVAIGLNHIADTTVTLRKTACEKRISISMRSAFATHFVAPQLAAFQKEFPDLCMEIVTNSNPYEKISSVDIVIALGEVNEPLLRSDFLFSEKLFPICSPAYLEKNPGFTTPDSLAEQTLLHLENNCWQGIIWRPIDWHILGRELRCNKKIKKDGHTFDDYTSLIESITAGAGVAIGWMHLACWQLQSGSLIRPLKESYDINRNHYLVMSSARVADNREVEHVRQWILEQTAFLRENET